jgi:hypothetical protein
VTGHWSGRHGNVAGEADDTRLRLEEAGDGTVSGTWDDVPIVGERIGGLVLSLAGRSPGRSLRMVGRTRGDQLLASYAARGSAGRRSGRVAVRSASPEDPPLRSMSNRASRGRHSMKVGVGLSEADA